MLIRKRCIAMSRSKPTKLAELSNPIENQSVQYATFDVFSRPRSVKMVMTEKYEKPFWYFSQNHLTFSRNFGEKSLNYFNQEDK